MSQIAWINFFFAFLTLFVEFKAAPKSACAQFFNIDIWVEISGVIVTNTRVSWEPIWRVFHAFEEGVSVYVSPHITGYIGLVCDKGHDLVGFVFVHDTHHAITVVKIAASIAWVIAEVVFQSIEVPLLFPFIDFWHSDAFCPPHVKLFEISHDLLKWSGPIPYAICVRRIGTFQTFFFFKWDLKVDWTA